MPMKKVKEEEPTTSPFSFHDYIDRFTLATIAVAAAGVAATVLLRRRQI